MNAGLFSENLTSSERSYLLKVARSSIELKLKGEDLPPISADNTPVRLLEPGVTFVTLTINGILRGCVGALEAYQPLIEDVREHAIAAALHDYRFPSLTIRELSEVKIEISRLTKPKKINYSKPEELINLIHPGIDGVIVQDGIRRATFLPQVWEKLPEPSNFLSHLCEKMGSNSNLWKYKNLLVYTYQVEMFHE